MYAMLNDKPKSLCCILFTYKHATNNKFREEQVTPVSVKLSNKFSKASKSHKLIVTQYYLKYHPHTVITNDVITYIYWQESNIKIKCTPL